MRNIYICISKKPLISMHMYRKILFADKYPKNIFQQQ